MFLFLRLCNFGLGSCFLFLTPTTGARLKAQRQKLENDRQKLEEDLARVNEEVVRKHVKKKNGEAKEADGADEQQGPLRDAQPCQRRSC